VRRLVLGKQPVDAVVAGRQAAAAGTGQAVGVGIDADHVAQLDDVGMPLQLGHQVGADVARSHDRGADRTH